jgi:hypothetical protein
MLHFHPSLKDGQDKVQKKFSNSALPLAVLQPFLMGSTGGHWDLYKRGTIKGRIN